MISNVIACMWKMKKLQSRDSYIIIVSILPFTTHVESILCHESWHKWALWQWKWLSIIWLQIWLWSSGFLFVLTFSLHPCNRSATEWHFRWNKTLFLRLMTKPYEWFSGYIISLFLEFACIAVLPSHKIRTQHQTTTTQLPFCQAE